MLGQPFTRRAQNIRQKLKEIVKSQPLLMNNLKFLTVNMSRAFIVKGKNGSGRSGIRCATKFDVID